MEITKDLILGSKITDVFTHHSELDGYPTCEAYFTNSNGITFSLPSAGYAWETTKIHPEAKKLEDLEGIAETELGNETKTVPIEENTKKKTLIGPLSMRVLGG